MGYRVDIYRIVYYYLTPTGAGPVDGVAGNLDLVRWVSEPLADGIQLDNIQDEDDRREVCEHLVTASPDAQGETRAPVMVAWRVGDSVSSDDTFRQITEDGELVLDPEAPRVGDRWQILPDVERSEPRLFERRYHHIASNFAPKICGVGRFGYVTSSGDGFPHGFEVQIIGPASARQILVHTSLVGSRAGRLAHFQTQLISDARDL